MSKTSTNALETVVPAQLLFLTIYNPTLGEDDTVQKQIVYHYSSKSKPGVSNHDGDGREEQNERLRQVGLAQGMVKFAQDFSNGEIVDSVESEKSRILLHQLEPDWWILASIGLTRLESRLDPTRSQSSATPSLPTVEYLSREVSPQNLLLQQLLRAHQIFLLHHAATLRELLEHISRQRFSEALERFWNKFIRDWDVLLHGNPAVDIYNGLKLAAGGELGIGVGEEEWGSGEREVLEGFISRTDGLVDVIASRFGEPPKGLLFANNEVILPGAKEIEQHEPPWLGSGTALHPSDGVIFSGIGAITRSSVRSISAWMEWIFKYGNNTYGVRDNPHSARQKKKRRLGPARSTPLPTMPPNEIPDERPKRQSDHIHNGNETNDQPSPGVSPQSIPTSIKIPPPIVRAGSSVGISPHTSPTKDANSSIGAENLMKYMTLGIYGSSWGIPFGRLSSHQASDVRPHRAGNEYEASSDHTEKPRKSSVQDANRGLFLVGLLGSLDDEVIPEDDDIPTTANKERQVDAEQEGWNERIRVGTLHIERQRLATEGMVVLADGQKVLPVAQFERLRVVVYVRQPFMFTFLFEPSTDSLEIAAFYRSLHHQLGPLQRPLLVSTSPKNVFERLWEAISPKTVGPDSAQPIYDLVYDPSNLSVHTTIPSIPESESVGAEETGTDRPPWTRMEALNVHSQILNTHISTRTRPSELERTCKTSRGWWVVWMRLPRSRDSSSSAEGGHRNRGYGEAVLVRKSSDYVAPPARKTNTALFGRDSGANATWGGAGRLAEGIGIDTRKYIEGLLSLNR